MLAGLIGQDAEEMQRIGMSRLLHKNLAVELLGLAQAPGLVMLHRPSESLLGWQVKHKRPEEYGVYFAVPQAVRPAAAWNRPVPCYIITDVRRWCRGVFAVTIMSSIPCPPSLPLGWFEFRERPERLAGKWVGPAFRAGAPISYSVVVDGREVPFKFIRGQELGMDGPPRPVLVLLHGMGITIGSFHGIARYLLPRNDLLLIDYNSFSVDTGWPVGGVSMRLLAAGIWHVVNALELAQVSMAGSSLGGGLALMAATMAPQRVNKIALLNPACYPQQLPRMYRLARIPVLGEVLMWLIPARRLAEGVAYIGYSSPEKMPPEMRGCYTRNMQPARNRWRLMDVMRHLPVHDAEVADHLAEIRRLAHPTLILWGVQERLLDPESGRRLAKDLPNARLIEFDDLAHLPHDEAPERVGPLLADFLAEPTALGDSHGIQRAREINR